MQEETVEELKRAIEPLIKNDIEMIICEQFRNVEEIEIAIELAKSFGKTVAATMCMGKMGDEDGISVGECAVRMANAGADLVGLNCLFDPFMALDSMKLVKAALENHDKRPFLMMQPLGNYFLTSFHTFSLNFKPFINVFFEDLHYLHICLQTLTQYLRKVIEKKSRNLHRSYSKIKIDRKLL